MKQEVIQDFLTVPGIAGIALIDGLSRPYFHGFGANFDLKQEAIAQGIQQVLETTPEGFNSFEFQFDFYRIYLHKLKRGITLLVLTGNTLPQAVYTQAVRRVLLELQLDQEEDPIAAFQAIAAQIPLVWQPTLQKSKPAQITAKPPLPHGSSVANTDAIQVIAHPTPVPPPIAFPKERIKPAVRAASASQAANSKSANLSVDSVDLKDVLAAINALSQITTQYLGTLVVANYWKVTRPTVDWLNYFQIERSTHMTFSVQNPSQPLPSLTPQQHQWIQAWVAAFIERCSRVIRDFAKIVRQGLTEQQKAILFRPPQSVD